MKESVWGYWIVVLGIAVISLMMFFQNYTTSSEEDYYLIKNALEASMYEAVDYGYYKDTGIVKMNTEKFVENFVRRFAETVNLNKTYQLDFYQIYEAPPAATISVTTTTDTNFGDTQAANQEVEVTNRMTGILYTTKDYKPIKKTGDANPQE